ncbi:MAG: DegT/DnrJ/EryC1/StrS family aminotransferase, partial [Candidatus Sulfotelmatobacter sp.]
GYTCFAVPSAILFVGATPVYADIDPSTFNVSLATIQKACGDAVSSRIKAVLVQHTYGLPAELSPILNWASKRRVPVIEDCAHALGSYYRDDAGTRTEVGTLGDAAFFSSQWTKPVSTGLGGWARASDPKVHEHLCRFRDKECVNPGLWESYLLGCQVLARGVFSSSSLYWIALALYQNLYRRGVLVGTSSQEEFRAERPHDYAKKMSGFQQWLLNRRLRDISVRIHHRRLKQVYEAALDRAGLPTLKIPAYADPVLLRYPVRVAAKLRIMREARQRRIELGDWYKHPVDVPDNVSPEIFGYHAGMCPEAERAANEAINLPMHSGISERSAETIVSFVKEFV